MGRRLFVLHSALTPNVAVAEKASALRNEEYFREGVGGLIAPKPCAFSNVLDEERPLCNATNFPGSGTRSQAGKWRMEELQPVSVGKRKCPLLSWDRNELSC
jgi:hypothetical protein